MKEMYEIDKPPLPPEMMEALANVYARAQSVKVFAVAAQVVLEQSADAIYEIDHSLEKFKDDPGLFSLYEEACDTINLLATITVELQEAIAMIKKNHPSASAVSKSSKASEAGGASESSEAAEAEAGGESGV